MPFVMGSMAGPTVATETQVHQFINSKLSETSAVQSNISTPTIAENASRNTRYHGLLGVFGRGFFAKPVNHSDEENYRYLLALDR